MKIKNLGLQEYSKILSEMKNFTLNRDENTIDEIWLLQHPAVLTLGQAGKKEHILTQDHDIPIVQSDRGGQVTYHGPGQIICYVLLDLKKLQINIRELVNILEQSVIILLEKYNIKSHRVDKAPGVYINNKKICSVGLRVKKGCCYHGISFNLDLDLKPFEYINTCGYKDLEVTKLIDNIEYKNINTQLNKTIKYKNIEQDLTKIITSLISS